MTEVGQRGIGERVRVARERLGWSRETLAFHAGVSWAAVAQVETSRRINVRPRTLAGLAGALGVSIDYLVSGPAATPVMPDHQALLYDGDTEFMAAAIPFLIPRAGTASAALAATRPETIARLQDHLGGDGTHVQYVDSSQWGLRPEMAIGAIRTLIQGRLAEGAQWVRVLVEPAAFMPAPDAQLCARYESLLGLLLRGTPASLLCPYDLTDTDEAVLGAIRATHPHTVERTQSRPSAQYGDPAAILLSPGEQLWPRGTESIRAPGPVGEVGAQSPDDL